MDPVSALSLAANIFQVVGFALDVINVASQIHASGTSDQIENLRRSGETLRSATDLVAKEKPRINQPDNEDEEFFRLAASCVAVCREISQLLDKLTTGGNLDPKSTPSAVATAIKSIKTVWSSSKIKNLKDRLAEERASLQLYASVSITAKLNKQEIGIDQILSQVDSGSRNLLVAFTSGVSALKGQTGAIIEQQSQSETLAAARHEEILAAIRALTLNDIQTFQPWLDRGPLNEDQVCRLRQTLLSCLWFPPISDREDMIHEAHRKTFSWIFSDPEELGKPWDNFREFLETGSGSYWISGKAGSGKSTLMKYMFHHKTTRDLLRVWSGDSDAPRKTEQAHGHVFPVVAGQPHKKKWNGRLVMANFFFYYKGSPLQKSEAGVLRSLLHQILSTNPELVEAAFPERYGALANANTATTAFEPTVQELKRALTRTVQTRFLTHDSPVFFFAVDGLDEYDAEESGMGSLVETFLNLTRFPNVKMVLSSRPWMVFEESFEGCPRLHLHDLTRPDIIRFVTDKLDDHPRMKKLAANNPTDTGNLMTEIVDASSGVFLWVYLVVRSLLEGLTNYDGIDDLRARFQELPTDLEALFQHMWDRIPKRYRAEASRLLQLVEAGTASGQYLSLLGLCFAQEFDLEYVISAPGGKIKPVDEIRSKLESARGRLLSRCMGLVEVNKRFANIISQGLGGDDYPNEVEEAQGYPYVVFLHRTVYEYISAPAVQRQLVDASSTRTFEGIDQKYCAELALLSSGLLRVKTAVPYIPARLNVLAVNCLSRAQQVEAATSQSPTGALLELDRVMSQRLSGHFRMLTSPNLASLHWSHAATLYSNCHEEDEPPRHNFLSLAVHIGLVRFVEQALADGQKKDGRPLLLYALCPNDILQRLWSSKPSNYAMVELLLKHGADPNERWEEGTVWTAYLRSTLSATFKVSPDLRVLKAMIVNGADPNVHVPVFWWDRRTPIKRSLRGLLEFFLAKQDFPPGEEKATEALLLEILRLIDNGEPQESNAVVPQDSTGTVENEKCESVVEVRGEKTRNKKTEWIKEKLGRFARGH
ncbi:hypothetical protein QBC42DRAFT_300739 [Cladorrhinum samala]|uniref:NACHT domain-containing protein n=1 Tax=Cladorrhinum samala TaxID=585594 RepID=A0AAV9HAY6_9PEZI|nr:hypothetical protein QBC42DRAFT_300739 [Cladorrhinum samala]